MLVRLRCHLPRRVTHGGVEVIDQYLSLSVSSRVRLEFFLGHCDVDVYCVQIWEFVVEATFETGVRRNDVLLKHQSRLDDRGDSSGLRYTNQWSLRTHTGTNSPLLSDQRWLLPPRRTTGCHFCGRAQMSC